MAQITPQDMRQVVAELRAQLQDAGGTDSRVLAVPVGHVAVLLDAYEDTVTALRAADRFMEEFDHTRCN